ncbi:hypothetical protein ANCCEY_05296 [Ancylostoma ceylanicum]|uniref:Uncharacterized protein n=1 Tax=Ancylostoma ceylanicum TaxID=53326 RepID=A0A0D6M6U2_9BILA|nr:hypothetical protein ANCCEY_05296 [Ancylostoma ceylanicum]
MQEDPVRVVRVPMVTWLHGSPSAVQGASPSKEEPVCEASTRADVVDCAEGASTEGLQQNIQNPRKVDGSRAFRLSSATLEHYLLGYPATTQSVKNFAHGQEPVHYDLSSVWNLNFEMFRAATGGSYQSAKSPDAVGFPPKLDPLGKVMIGRVRAFFKQLKRQLGGACEETIFESPVQLITLACSVSTRTISKANGGMSLPMNSSLDRESQSRSADGRKGRSS